MSEYAAQEIINYMYKDELESWEETDRPANHIFWRLVELGAHFGIEVEIPEKEETDGTPDKSTV